MHQADIYDAVFFFLLHCWSCEEEAFGTAAVLTQDKCSAFWLKLFPQRPPLYSQAAVSAALSVCESTIHALQHTAVMNLHHMLHFIPPLLCCCILGWSIQRKYPKYPIYQRKYPSSQVLGGREQKGKWRLVWHNNNQNEGSNWFAITPPADQPVFDVDLLPGVCRGASCGADLTPADLTASPAWPGHPRCASWASVMQSILVRRQTTDVTSCRFQLTHQPLTLPPHDATDAERQAMIFRDTNMSLKAHTGPKKQTNIHEETSSCSSCVNNKSNWPAPAKPHNAIET